MDKVPRIQMPRVDVEPTPLSGLAKPMGVQLLKINFLIYKMDKL